MSDALVKWWCSECDAELESKQPKHRPCHAASRWRCEWSEASGLYKNYKRHTDHCPHCSPDRARQIHAEERADKENRLSSAAEDESSQSAGTPCSGRGRRRRTHQPVLPLSFQSSCSPEIQQEPWASWSTDKAALLSYTGMSAAEVELVYAPCKDKLLALAAQQHHRDANTPTLTSHNVLVISLHWLRQKPAYHELARLYGHGQHYWHDMLRRVVAVLSDHIYDLFVQPLAPDASTSVFFANCKIIVDSTFVPLPKNTFVRQDYHQKSPTKSAWKYEIACDFSHRIISCSQGFHGGQHDMRIIRESGLLDQSSPSALIMGDKGYKGQLGIIVPACKRAKVCIEVRQLEEEKQRGHELQSERAAIENINQRVKQWAVAREVWTGIRDPELIFNEVMRVVCALANVILRTHPLRAREHPKVGSSSVS